MASTPVLPSSTRSVQTHHPLFQRYGQSAETTRPTLLRIRLLLPQRTLGCRQVPIRHPSQSRPNLRHPSPSPPPQRRRLPASWQRTRQRRHPDS